MNAPPFNAVFVSDVHLGMRLARESGFADWLDGLATRRLYLNGDILDGWRLGRRWSWTATRTRIANRLLELGRSGTAIVVLAGNHDDFLRRPLPDIIPWPVVDEWVHECEDGRKLLVTHGDLFDPAESRRRTMSRLGSRLFDGATLLLPREACHWIKRTSKRVFGRPGRLTDRIEAVARERNLDGFVFGHIHQPLLELRRDGLVAANCGDWVQHCSFLAELPGGQLQLFDGGQVVARVPVRGDRQAASGQRDGAEREM